MPASFDGDNLVITLPSHGGSGVLNLDAQIDLYSDWKEWLIADSQRTGLPPAFRTTGGDGLTPGIDTGAYYFIRNDYGWRVRPFEEHSTVYLNGNLTPQDSSLPILIPTIGAFSVLVDGLQPITQNVDAILEAQKSAAFRGTISIDTVGGRAGTEWPIGTDFDPSNNLIDAVAIGLRERFRSIELFGEITLHQNFETWKFIGLISKETAIINLGGRAVGKSKFESVILRGTGTGEVFAVGVKLDGVAGISGTIKDSVLLELFAPSGNSNTSLIRCSSGRAGLETAIIDLADLSAANFQVRPFVGGLEVRNIDVANQKVSLDVLPGHIKLHSSCDLGTVVIRGQGKLTNNSTGNLVIDDDGFIDARKITSLFKIDTNKQVIDTVANELLIFDDDGVQVLHRFDLQDSVGNPSSIQLFRRLPKPAPKDTFDFTFDITFG